MKPSGLKRAREVMEEVRNTVGMDQVSEEFDEIIAEALHSRLMRQKGKGGEQEGTHLVLTGNPGTGKTMIAKKIAEVYGALGVTKENKMVTASRADLVAGFTGQTAPKVRKLFEEAKGGVLFVDEAYALYQGEGDNYGKEAITELMALAEDNRSDTVVILAGYPKDMDGFFRANPGLASRFPKKIRFPDYRADELSQIGRGMLDKTGLTLDDDASAAYEIAMDKMREEPRFAGNARDVRQLNGIIRRSVANRVATIDNPTDGDVTGITAEDVETSYTRLLRGISSTTNSAVKPKKKKKRKKEGTLVPLRGGAA